jgi:hypothetical protein
VTSVVHEHWQAISRKIKKNFTTRMQPKRMHTVNARRVLARKSELRLPLVRARFSLRQGLWIEDLRTPPGQECSNGSLILLAVVLWRTFLVEGLSS